MTEIQARFTISCVDESEVTPETDRAIRELLCECFPDDVSTFAHTRSWHGSGPVYSMVCLEGGRALGHVGVVVREISCDGLPVRIAGIQNVAVSPSRRKTGLSRQAMEESMAEAERRGIPYGMLFCVPGLERFYGSLGWQRTEAAVTMVDDAGRNVPLDDKNIAMVKVLNGQPFTAREVHLEGADW